MAVVLLNCTEAAGKHRASVVTTWALTYALAIVQIAIVASKAGSGVSARDTVLIGVQCWRACCENGKIRIKTYRYRWE